MNILFVVPYVPNPIRVRPYELLRTLAQRGHALTLATLWQSKEERQEIAKLEDLGITVAAKPLPKLRALWNSASALPTRTPLQARYCWQPALADLLEQLVAQESFAVAHVEHLRGAAYGLHLRTIAARTGYALPVVWDSVDCISHLFAQAAKRSRSLSGRFMTTLELARTRRYEGWLLDQFPQVLVTSKVDQQALCTLAKQYRTEPFCGNRVLPTRRTETCCEKPVVLPNGVDLSYFRHRAAAQVQEQTTSDTADSGPPPTVVFSGKMSYHANITAARYLVDEIMPRVWAQYPETRVQLVGKDPPAQIRALARTATHGPNGKPQQGAVEVTGTVPDLPPYLQRATVAAAPLLYGAGIQNKVLEAMACGAPVVTTRQAAGGMQAKPGQDLLVADDTQTFADEIVRLIADPAERQALGDAGRAYVEANHSWFAVVDRLEEIYQTTMAQ
ncbi:MAG: glycosyltransferase [Caldilineaceae bacterium]|nr:glycosyltransferase [Caldilineaceae bacterium]